MHQVIRCQPGMVTGFNRSVLSEREAQVLDQAVEGLTDCEIAHRLNITTSTVNSYWARIRTKSGYQNRVELIAATLKERADARIAASIRRQEELESLAGDPKSCAEDRRQAELYRAALEAIPEAICVLDDSGRIVFGNALLEDIFGFPMRELTGLPMGSLVHQLLDRRGLNLNFSHEDASRTKRYGIDSVVYANQRGGNQLRVILLVGSRETPGGWVTTCLIRPFLAEVDHLRQRVHSLKRERGYLAD